MQTSAFVRNEVGCRTVLWRSILLLAVMFVCHVRLVGQDVETPKDLGTTLMESSFRISGPSSKNPGEIAYGTAFVVGLPMKNDTSRAYYVLVTAAHVLEDIQGETATLMLRSLSGPAFSERPVLFRIRTSFYNLYYRSSDEDVAVAFISLPSGFYVHPVPVSFFVTDDRIKNLELHPGDELFVLGFPLYASLNTFPVLRSGILSSYPLYPMKSVHDFYLNFRVFPGNSGGPVYFDFANRSYLSKGTVIGREWGIIGLVKSELSSSASGQDEPLDISQVVPAAYITDAISALGPAPLPKYTFVPFSGNGPFLH